MIRFLAASDAKVTAAYDPFLLMQDEKKVYGFTLSLFEYIETIPTLWNTTKQFIAEHPEHIHEDNAMAFLSDDGGESYNKCHCEWDCS